MNEEEQLKDKREKLVNEYPEALKEIGGHGSAKGAFAGQAVKISYQENVPVEQVFEKLLETRTKVIEMTEEV